MRFDSVKVVSFSGIDGAGKSTQIEILRRYLQDAGLHFKLYTFWDDVVALPSFRERLSISVFKGDSGVGSPDKPIVRRDKNVTSWYIIGVRLFLYLLDAFRLCVIMSRSAEGDADFVIFDRYIYDELANLPLQHWAMRLYIRLLLKFIPKPDIAFLLDAEPEAAVRRKPEYPLEFVRRNRDSYLTLGRVAGTTVLPPLAAEETAKTIQQLIATRCLEAELENISIRMDRPVAPGAAKTHGA